MLKQKDLEYGSGFKGWNNLEIASNIKMYLPPAGVVAYGKERLTDYLAPWEEESGLLLLLPETHNLPAEMGRWAITVSYFAVGAASGRHLDLDTRYLAGSRLIELWNTYFLESKFEKSYEVVPLVEGECRINIGPFKDGQANSNGMLGGVSVVVKNPDLGACQNTFTLLYTREGVLVFRFLAHPLQYFNASALFTKLIAGVRIQDSLALPFNIISEEEAEQARQKEQPSASDIFTQLRPIFITT